MFVVDWNSENPAYTFWNTDNFYMHPRFGKARQAQRTKAIPVYRGAFYRYDDPYEPVAQDDWEILK